MKAVTVILPLATVFLAAWLTHNYFTVDSYNWWYIGLYPGFLGILCGMIGGKDKRKKNYTIWPLPCSMGRIWDAKILTGAGMSAAATACVFMSCQAVFAAAASLAELLLNPLGYTLAKSVESASSVNTTLSMFIYSTLAAPAAEELVFRGYVLRRMLPYGKEFAIVISAVLFGLMHGNFVQGLFAAGTGLVLGYVAVEYSLKWSILIHLLNNLVFSDLLGRIAGVTAEPLKSVLEYGIPAAFFAAACVILFLNREAIGRWRRENRIGGRYYFYAFTTVWMILFILMEVLTAMNGIGKI